VRRAVASDKRIGAAFLFPGCGYGGSCFPKDVKAILKFSKDKGYTFKILESVEAVNASQKHLMVARCSATSAR
jgi:UDPglucose 6-dehydrogenase